MQARIELLATPNRAIARFCLIGLLASAFLVSEAVFARELQGGTRLHLDRHVTLPSPFRLEIQHSEYRLAGDQRIRAPHQGHLAKLVEKHASAKGLDPELVHAVIRAESAFRADAVSPKGAVGLMQVMPMTGKRFGINDLASPESNLVAGTTYLRHLLDRFHNLPLALAAYNAGEGAVMRAGGKIPAYPETRGYVQAVMRNYQESFDPGMNEFRLYIDGARLAENELALYRLNPEAVR